MKLHLLFVGKTSEAYLKTGIEIYMKRIPNYIAITTAVVSASDLKNTKQAVEEEYRNIQSKLLQGDFIVVMDEKGTELSSRQLGDLFSKWMGQGLGRVVFIIGGAHGIAQGLKEKANYQLSLSKLTFTHQMSRLILTEQLYRALTITRNEGYHHD